MAHEILEAGVSGCPTLLPNGTVGQILGILPSGVPGYLNSSAAPATVAKSSQTVTLAANMPLVIMHSLGLTDPDAFIANFRDSAGRTLDLQIVSSTANTITLVSSTNVTAKIIIIG